MRQQGLLAVVVLIGMAVFVGVMFQLAGGAAAAGPARDVYLPLVVKGWPPPTPTVTTTPTTTRIPTVTNSPTVTPSRTSTPTLTPTPPPGRPWAGLWKGQAITDGYPAEPRAVTFTVVVGGANIASGARVDSYYRKQSGFWICSGTIQWTVEVPVAIADDGTFRSSGGLISKLTWEGRFVSPTRAEGTFHEEVFTGLCGKAIHDGTWWATWDRP